MKYVAKMRTKNDFMLDEAKTSSQARHNEFWSVVVVLSNSTQTQMKSIKLL